MAFVRNAFLPYVALVALFYVQSGGFVKFHDTGYAFWKVLPVSTLGALMYFFATTIPERERKLHAFGLLLGALGDFLIGYFENGIVTGAIAFGIGHMFYLSTFARRLQKPTYALAGGLLVYGMILNHFCLMPQLGAHPINTVILFVYSLLLSSAVIISGSMFIEGTTDQSPNEKENLVRFIGFGIFAVSDSTLILDHSGYWVPYAEVIILSTYFTAQFVIMWSACLAPQSKYNKVRSHMKAHRKVA
uniref:lysoplasmalogenase n=1 Tax=Steinernema glaseri TaxID=37863 RepID=A0A1I8ADC0_9BILA